MTAGYRPMLHGDRWLHMANRMSKRFKGNLFQFLQSQFAGDPEKARGGAKDHIPLMLNTTLPKRLYRSYGAQFAIDRDELLRKPLSFYERLHVFVTTRSTDLHKNGWLAIWRSQTSKEKAMLLEIAWMGMFEAERYVKVDVCKECLAVAKELPKDEQAIGASCTADFYQGAPRDEVCRIVGSGSGGSPRGRLHAQCPVTRNDYDNELLQEVELDARKVNRTMLLERAKYEKKLLKQWMKEQRKTKK